jgi:hypothetical protein
MEDEPSITSGMAANFHEGDAANPWKQRNDASLRRSNLSDRVRASALTLRNPFRLTFVQAHRGPVRAKVHEILSQRLPARVDAARSRSPLRRIRSNLARPCPSKDEGCTSSSLSHPAGTGSRQGRGGSQHLPPRGRNAVTATLRAFVHNPSASTAVVRSLPRRGVRGLPAPRETPRASPSSRDPPTVSAIQTPPRARSRSPCRASAT